MMYESPIRLFFPKLEEEICNIAKKQDDMVFDAVAKVGVTVDRDELLRALQYDRDQYDKGFADGKVAAMDELVRCKDCRFIIDRKDGTHGCYRHFVEDCKTEDFCSYGERRSE